MKRLVLKKLAIVALFLAWSCSNTREQPFFVVVPIEKFSSIRAPCVNVEIEGKLFSMELDLGCRGDVALAKRCIDPFSFKEFVGEKTMYGVRGKKFSVNLWRVPKIQIGGMTFSSLVLQEENSEFLKDSTFLQNGGEPSSREMGRLGWELFSSTKFLIDIRNSRIVFCNSLNTLKKKGYAIETFVETPLFLERGVVEFEATTPKGPLRCVLDTGTTWNILNEEIDEGKSIDQAVWELENRVQYPTFKAEGADLGPVIFHRMPIRIPIHIEAILGMEFFENHLVFLDFAKRAAYFEKPKPYTCIQ